MSMAVLLALLIAIGNAALSGHAASHVTQDKGFCALCIQASAGNGAIPAEPVVIVFTPGETRLIVACTPSCDSSASQQIHPARAPPQTA